MSKTIYSHDDLQTFYIETEVEDEENLSLLLPERRLLSAILERSFLDLSLDDDKLKKEAYQWFIVPEVENPTLTSLQGICLYLNLNFLEIQKRILQIVKI